jgi:hypothetical protein
MPTIAEYRAKNEEFVELLRTDVKKAAEMSGNYTRLKLREESFMERILPSEPITPDQYDQALHTDKPYAIFHKEQDVSPAMSVSYGGMPNNFFIFPNKFAVTPQVVLSPRVTKNTLELRTYPYDVKQVFADNLVKDLQAVKDAAGIGAVNTVLIAQGTPTFATGAVQWTGISGGLTFANVVESQVVMQQIDGYTLMPENAVCTTVTLARFAKWRRDEAGGDLAERTLLKGWVEDNFSNENWHGTLKRRLVADNTIFHFAGPKFLGKSLEFTPPTMYIDEKYWMYSFFVMMEIGTTFSNIAGITRSDIT